MTENFDPYHQWLGIPPDEQPPNYYRLLGIPLLETSAAVIEHAANQRMGHLRTFQTGKHSADSQRLLNEVSAARVCLLRPEKKAVYDQELRKKLAPKAGPVVAEAQAIDSGLAEIFQTRSASSGSAIQRHRSKRQPKISPPLLAAMVAGAVATVLFGLWLVISQNDKPSDKQTAVAAPHGSGNSEPPPTKPRPSTSAASTAASAPISPKPSTAAPQMLVPPKASGTDLAPTKTEDSAVGSPAVAAAAQHGTAAPAVPDSAAKTEAPSAVEPACDSFADEQKAPQEEKQAAKRAPPPAELQKKLIAEIDDIYKSKEAKDPAARAALAHKLLDEGRKMRENADEQFALLRRASELASDAGETDLMMEVVDAMAAAGFDIQPLRVKARLLKRMLEQTSLDGEQISAACEICTRFAEEDAAHDGVQDGANEALDVLDAARKAFAESARRAQSAYIAARAAAARTRDATEKEARTKKAAQAESDLDAAKAAQSAVAQCVKTIQQTARQQLAVQAAQEKLKTSPDDPAACLTIGRWLCFHEGNWDEGVKYLAKGSDQTLKTLAANELASKPSTADQRVARGDAWWDAAVTAAGDDKLGIRRRAEYWYSRALPDLNGLAKAKVEKRLDLLAKDASSAPEAKDAAALRNAVLAKTKSIGGSGGESFEDGDASDMLVGLTVTTGRYSGHKTIDSVQAIYLSGRGQVIGKRHGRLGREPVTLLAKPGYAVGGISAVGNHRFDGFCIVFMRVKGHQLDPAKTYESDWVGDTDNREGTRLGCDGKLLVGIFGREGPDINAVGLIQLVPDQRRASDASSTPAAKVAPAARNAVLTKTKIIGGKVGQDFEESKAEDMLIGLTITTGDFSGHKVISSIQATYQSGRGQVSGNIYGKRKGEPVTLLAKPGYAVAGIKPFAGIRFAGFRIVFMRIKGHQLDPADTYESDWVGGKESDDRPNFGCDGNPVVGIFGKQGGNIVAIGLIQLAPGTGADSRAAAP